ncbi:PNMT methyltransferase, partial [Grantiella picta]|nr:PNMT methyltransferase [Grantiella picta]
AALREGYERFDPRAYLRNNYLPPRADFSSEEFVVPWKLRCLAETFASGEIRGRTLIDVGSGPTIYQLLSACDHFEEIVATDYLAVNREELGRGHEGGTGGCRGTPEGGRCWGDPGRIVSPSPTGSQPHVPVGFCPQISWDHSPMFLQMAVSPDRAAFVRALAHVGNLLRPGGHALLLGALGESFYLAGPARLPVVPLEESDVREALAAAGFALRELRSYVMPPALRTGVDDVDGVFFAPAQQ